MRTAPVARSTIAACSFAAAAQVILGCTATAGLTPGDSLIVLLIIAPYAFLCLLAWRHRHSAVASWALLVAAIALGAWGLYVVVLDTYRYYTVPQHRMVQRMAVFMVPLIQCLAVLVIGFGLLVAWLCQGFGRLRPETYRGTGGDHSSSPRTNGN